MRGAVLLTAILFLPGCKIVESFALKVLYPFEKVNENYPGNEKDLAIYPNPRGPIIFYLHGNGENILAIEKSNLSSVYQTIGTFVVSEYPGIDPVEGEPDQGSLTQKAVSDFRKVEALYPKKEKVIIGRSLGAAVAAQLASRVDHDALILISPWTKFRDAASASFLGIFYRFLSKTFRLDHEWNSETALKGPERRALVLHGRTDTLIPPELGKSLSEAINANFVLINAGHNDIYGQKETWILISDFISGEGF